jgi:hypothetical protein
MTDATLPVTERTISEFVTDYLESLGATIQKDERRWTISMPDALQTGFSLDDTVVHLVTDPEEVDDDAVALAPGSDLFERIIDDAVDRAPLGSVTLTGDDVNFDTPDWVGSDSVEVTGQRFTPYYDRNALCVLFHIGIETVSEYQREALRAGAVDLADHEPRPRLAETYLELGEHGGPPLSEADCTLNSSELAEAVDVCRDVIQSELDPEIRGIREKATRRATAEIEEYRQYLQQRQDELRDEKGRLTDRIDELSEAIDTASERTERLEYLRKRKQLRNDLTELRDELDDVRASLSQGMPEKRTEVRDRHALTVRIRPVTATVISYERGDLDISLQSGANSATVTCDYAVGVGALTQPSCDQCGTAVDSQNPVAISNSLVIGRQCCDR